MPHSHNCHEGHEGCHCQPSAKIERFIQPTLLLSLLEQPSHGYELLDRLGSFRFYSGAPDPGAIYRHLRRLENEGFVESQWETGEAGPAKRTYSITERGIELLKAWTKEMTERRAAIDDFLERYRSLSETDHSQFRDK